MKNRDTISFALPLCPLPAAVVFLLWPCLGVTLAVGATAFTSGAPFRLASPLACRFTPRR